MSQIISTRSLSKSQVKTTLNNLFALHRLDPKSIKLEYEGKPKFSKTDQEQYGLSHITKFGSRYEMYSGKILCNDETDKMHEDNGKLMIYIVLYDDKFDKLHYLAMEWFVHLFQERIERKSVRPRVYIMPSYQLTEAMVAHIPDNIMVVNYRAVSLANGLYPLLGSRSGLMGLCNNYKIIDGKNHFNGKPYPMIYDSDPMCKAINAVVGDCIMCERVLNEMGTYSEYSVRTVIKSEKYPGLISLAGISYNEFKDFVPA